jgi:hypothetical protein
MRSRRCSGPGRPLGDTKASGRRVTCKAPFGPTWKEGQADPRRRPQPFSRILTAWKGYSRKSVCRRSRIPRSDRATIFCMNIGGGGPSRLFRAVAGLRGRYLKADGFGLGKGERERFA